MEAGVSQRQFSFIESGRSVPKRETLLAIAEALDVPLRERNTMLLASGYAPFYSEVAWKEPEMHSIRAAIDRMLRQQEPFPALLMDRYWNVLSSNDATLRFFGLFTDMKARMSRRNLLHLMFDPAGMRPFIHDWENTSRALLERVQREAIGRVTDLQTQELVDELLAYPGTSPSVTASSGGQSDLPMIPLSFVRDGVVLNYFSMVSVVGAPRTITSQELRVECLFPVDESTERRHLALMQNP